MEGEFHVTREVENAHGDVLRRTYFHGGIDFRRVSFCVEEGGAAARGWCHDGVFGGGGSGGSGDGGNTLVGAGAVGLIATSSE